MCVYFVLTGFFEIYLENTVSHWMIENGISAIIGGLSPLDPTGLRMLM